MTTACSLGAGPVDSTATIFILYNRALTGWAGGRCRGAGQGQGSVDSLRVFVAPACREQVYRARRGPGDSSSFEFLQGYKLWRALLRVVLVHAWCIPTVQISAPLVVGVGSSLTDSSESKRLTGSKASTWPLARCGKNIDTPHHHPGPPVLKDSRPRLGRNPCFPATQHEAPAPPKQALEVLSSDAPHGRKP